MSILAQKSNALDDVSKQAFKETPEQMIRSLQGFFCKDRYRYWVFTKDKKATNHKMPYILGLLFVMEITLHRGYL